MKKLVTLFVCILVAVASFATTFSFSTSVESQTIDGITVKLDKGSGNNAPAVYSDQVRLYAGNTITVSGGNLTDISLSFTKQGSKAYAALSSSVGTLSSGGESTSNTDVKTDTWKGTASSVTLTLGDTGQRIVLQIVVNGDGTEPTPGTGGNGNGNDNPGDNPGTLDPNYTYKEPTVITTPAMTVQGDSYRFISNNIEVSCSKGAVSDGTYFSAHAGFDMTFKATRNIKGIVINGFVKKDFSATVDKGTVSFLSPSSDTERNPVVVITDINSNSVTISCVKQLRCYNVEFYFENNPDATVEGGSGSTQTLTFDSAEAVYESEYTEIVGEENYSIFLFNASAPDYPYLALDLYPGDSDNLKGEFSIAAGTLGDYTFYLWGEGDYDMTWAESAKVTISTEDDEHYTITGMMVGDNNVTYEFTFTGVMPLYLDSDYYYGDDDNDGVEEIPVQNEERPILNRGERMYDMQGRRVGRNYRGVVIQNNAKYILR